MAFLSPLRYPGGKGKLSNFIKLLIQENDLFDVSYIEPYAGGAGIAVSLLIDGFISQIYLNDISRSIYAFWYSVINNTDELCSLIYDTNVTINEWQRQKDFQEHRDGITLLDLGFSTFFLNRTNRSGIIRGGVIGGKNQKGPHKLDARYNKVELIARIQRIARFKNRIHLFNLDTADFFIHELPKVPEDSLLYLDPPYYLKQKELYENHYNQNDHLYIANMVKKIPHHWIISYNYNEDIIQLYRNYKYLSYSLNYCAGNRVKGSEIMFFSDKINIPFVESPIKITKRRIIGNIPIHT